jgi:hypothetical protein
MKPFLNLAAAFAAGAAAVYFLDQAVMRRRAHRQEPRLRKRVDEELAALVSHPEAIKVSVEGGLVRVSGFVLLAEQDRLLTRLTQLPGVHRVHNALSAVADASRFDELRRGTASPGSGDELQAQSYMG